MVALPCPRLEKSPGSLSGRGSCRDEDAISKASELFVSLLAWLSGTASRGCVLCMGQALCARVQKGFGEGVASGFPMQCGSSSTPQFVFIKVKSQKLWPQPLPLVRQISAVLSWLVAAQLGSSLWCCLHPLSFPCPHPCCCCPSARQGWEQAQHQEVYPGRRKQENPRFAVPKSRAAGLSG